jgi:hypothetical protein
MPVPVITICAAPPLIRVAIVTAMGRHSVAWRIMPRLPIVVAPVRTSIMGTLTVVMVTALIFSGLLIAMPMIPSIRQSRQLHENRQNYSR